MSTLILGIKNSISVAVVRLFTNPQKCIQISDLDSEYFIVQYMYIKWKCVFGTGKYTPYTLQHTIHTIHIKGKLHLKVTEWHC